MKKRRSHPELQCFNPCRPPDWRWRRAVQLVADGTYLIKWRDDEPTRRAVKLLRALKRCRSERGVRGLTKRKPSMMMALQLHERGGLRCQELHARVLARQSAVAIAREMGLTVGMIEVYIEWFFAVSDRIKAPGYVLCQAVKWPVDGSAPLPEQFMLAVAFYHGPHALEAYLDFLPHAGEPHDLATSLGRQREAFEILTAAHSLPSDEATRDSFAKRAAFVFETGAKHVDSRPVEQVFASQRANALPELPWADAQQPATIIEGGQGDVDHETVQSQNGMVA